MPREIIHAENPGANTSLQVRWTPSQDLQLGIETVQGVGLLHWLYREDKSALGRTARAVEAVVLDYQKRAEGSHEELGDLILDAIEGTYGTFTGVWVESLSRHGTQQLIKALRRARNQVWGADE